MDYLKRIKEYRVLGALALLAAFIVLVANVSEVAANPAIDIGNGPILLPIQVS